MPSVADILLEQGAIAARARELSGQAWGNAVSNIAQIPAQVIAANRVAQNDALAQKELQTRIALGQQQVMAGQQQAKDTATVDQLWSDPTIYGSDGMINRSGLQSKLAAANAGHLWPKVAELADTLDESRGKILDQQQKLYAAHQETLGNAALKIEAVGNDPDSFKLTVTDLSRPDVGVLTQDQANKLLQVSTPEQVKAAISTWKAGTSAAKPKITVVPEGATPLVEGPDGTLKPVTGFTPTPKPTTEAELDAKAQLLLAKQSAADAGRGADLTPEESDALKAYQDRKRTVSDPAALAATERQTAAINAQIAQQDRAQKFTEAERGRALLDANDKTYKDATKSADELRATVAAAKAGNKFAASQQSLQATMATIRSQGLNRINTAEIGAAASAGNLFDRIAGRIDKVTAGQPLPADIQKDILEYADVLEKSAYKGYADTFDTTKQRYPGLEKEVKKSAPAGYAPPPLHPEVQALLDRK